jgi:hypothetical protein
MASNIHVEADFWLADADEIETAAGGQHGESLLGHGFQANKVEDVVRAVGQEVADNMDRIALCRVDRVGGAELFGRLQPFRLNVDGHNTRRTSDARAAHRVKPNAACAKDDNRVACANSRGVQDGACSCDDAAAEQRRLGEGYVFRYRGKLVFVDKSALGESAEPHALGYANAMTAQARRLSRPPQGCLSMRALEGAARLASRARPAGLHERANNVVPNTELCDVGPNRGDDPRDFMTQYDGRRSDIVSRKQKVGVAEPGRTYFNENFAPHRLGDVDVLKLESAAEYVDDESLHGWSPQAEACLT